MPVKVYGDVKKGDKLVAGLNGHAKVKEGAEHVFAIALNNKDDNGAGIVEAVIL